MKAIPYLSKPKVCLLAVVVLALIYDSSAATEKTLHDFNPFEHGLQPNGSLVMDGNENLYGTTVQGGVSTCNFGVGCGTVFELTPEAGNWKEVVLYNFAGGDDGWNPEAVVLDESGNIYGSTSAGGAYNGGTIFELSPNGSGGWTERTLYAFTQGSDGGQPNLVTLGENGDLYGTTYSGGSGCGVAFELSPAGTGGWTETILYTFAGGTDACHPAGKAIFDGGGNLFGPAGGGEYGAGSVFELTGSQGNWAETVLYSFSGSTGSNPDSVIFGPDGNLYGTTASGGFPDAGTVFELTLHGSQWSLNEIYVFAGGSDGADPDGVVFDAAGNLYGVASQGGSIACQGGCGTIYRLENNQGIWSQNVLYTFPSDGEGATPVGDLIFDEAGNLYGSSAEGGSSCFGPGFGCGTIFELTPASGGAWRHRLLFTFPLTDGEKPSTLVMGGADNFYGTTGAGGLNGVGTAFSLVRSPQGGVRTTVLYSFAGPPNDGADPQGGLVVDKGGNIYGVTNSGGLYGHGTVFELSPTGNGSWAETVLLNFSGGMDGGSPVGGLLLDAAGNLYGTTSLGGNGRCGRGVSCGIVFALFPRPDGKWKENVIYNFAGTPDGAWPMAGLTADMAGNLYGTTKIGGAFREGAVFRLVRGADGQWEESVLYSFTGQSDGANPLAAVTLDQVGNLFETTFAGGSTLCDCGTVVELTPAPGGQWNESTLYEFLGYPSDASRPESGLVFDSEGNLYGTTVSGGNFLGSCFPIGCGTIFELSPTQSGGWTEGIVYAFSYTDGNAPSGELIIDNARTFYGSTSAGGSSEDGVVFALEPLPLAEPKE